MFICKSFVTSPQILTQSEQLHSKMQQLEAAVAQGNLQQVADVAAQCCLLLSTLDNLPSLNVLRARIDEATLSANCPFPPLLLLLLPLFASSFECSLCVSPFHGYFSSTSLFPLAPSSGTRARAGSDLKAACAAGDITAGRAAADVLSKTSRDGQVQHLLLEACHDACAAAAADALAHRDSAVPFISHMRNCFDTVVTALQVRGLELCSASFVVVSSQRCSGCSPRRLLSTGQLLKFRSCFILFNHFCLYSGVASSYEKLCVMVVSSLQPRLQSIVQGSVDAAAANATAAAAATAATSSDDITSSSPVHSSAAAAAIVDVSRALCSLACSFLALHPDAHFSESGCRQDPTAPIN
jgi:hypothetical protein